MYCAFAAGLMGAKAGVRLTIYSWTGTADLAAAGVAQSTHGHSDVRHEKA
jgi:hypothetical protein